MAARFLLMRWHFWAAGWSNGWRGPDHWIIYAVVEQGNVADAEASTAVHHRKVGNHY